ncbi:lipocalin-like [Acipenser ruthenus]|uniref:lipocalin-like n=1 Tax=Acipenser ruthenus TaxID=7906 RepID=UPI002740D400|nr:lipocalin-like [Acipenser ruthenus]
MTAALLSVLAALLCVLSATAQPEPQKDFNLEKFSGKWYLIGMGSNAQWFVNKKKLMKMGTAVFTPTAEGNMDVLITSQKPSECWQMHHLFGKTETPGRFTFYSKAWGNENDVRVVETNYDEFALLHTIKTKGDSVSVLTKLYGRSQELRPELIQKFQQHSLAQGLTRDNVLILPKNVECTPNAA